MDITDKLQRLAWTVCCDFHDDPAEIAEHNKRWELQYGKDEAGVLIQPPPGWKILPFKTVIPNGPHREYTANRWQPERSGLSTMTPIYARPAGKVFAYAVKDHETK